MSQEFWATDKAEPPSWSAVDKCTADNAVLLNSSQSMMASWLGMAYQTVCGFEALWHPLLQSCYTCRKNSEMIRQPFPDAAVATPLPTK